MMPLLVIVIWEVARLIREQRQLQKERQELLEAEAALAVNRRPYFTVQQPDGDCAVCRVDEQYYERNWKKHVKQKANITSRLKSCFCVKGKERQSEITLGEDWQFSGPRLVQ
jgi:hypothetical protein